MSQVKSFFKDKELCRGIIVTILALLFIRLFYVVPTPGVNTTYFREVLANNSALGFLDVFTGSGLSNLSVMMLNITPYITASIIMQLLGNLFPRLREMQHGMRDEQKKVEKATVILGIVLAFFEALMLSIGYGKQHLFISYTWYWVVLVAVIWTIGTAMASIIGKVLMDKYNINGVSLILLLNILAGYPSAAKSLYTVFVEGKEPVWMGVALALIILAIIAFFIFTYYVQETELPIQVSYATKTNQPSFLEDGKLPIKLCPGTVVPVIFASSIMTTPILIASAFTDTEALWAKILSPGCWFIQDDMLPSVGVLIYLALIVAFSFYYSNITLNPKELAENFNKGGGVIPGVRPGKDTEKYLQKQMNKVVLLGAIALCIIALIPIIISGLFSIPKLSFLGTSVIITVGVLLEVKRYIVAHSKRGNYYQKDFEGGLF